MTLKSLGFVLLVGVGLIIFVGRTSPTESGGIGGDGGAVGGNCYASAEGPSTPTLCE